MALSTTRLASLLGTDPTFIARVAETLLGQATTVLAEAGVGPTHAARALYANRVISSPTAAAITAAPYLAQATNIVSTIAFEDNGIQTTVTDAALLSQVATSWNVLAGIDAGS